MSQIWVLMRGIGRESEHWGSFTQMLQQSAPGEEVIAIDHPGFGRQQERAVPSTIQAMMEADRIQVPRPGHKYILFGHSLGAMVALSWIKNHAEEVAGAVLINSSARDTSSVQDRLHVGAWSSLFSILTEVSERERESQVLKLVSRRSDLPEEVLQNWVKIARERSPSKWTLARQLWAASTFTLGSFPFPHPPILCLGSLGDELVNPRCSENLAHSLKAEFKLHPWAGHEITLDDPDWVLTQVQKWRAAL